MPNLATALKAEVVRLARKELRVETQGMRRALTVYRSEIANLKKRVQQLERELGRGGKAQRAVPKGPTAAEASKDEGSGLRFRAAGLAANRRRLGLSASDFGKLIGATGASIYAWEAGKSKPRQQNLAAIAALRGAGKREVAERLAALD